MRLVEGRGLPERFAWQQRLVSTATRCRPAPPSARCTLWPRHWTRTERREDSLWTGSSNMKTPTWPHPPCKTQTHTGVTHRCVFAWSCDHSAPCVFQCEGRHQQGGPGDPGVLQSQSQAGGVPWRVQQHTHTHSADITSCPLQLTVSCSCHQWSLEVFLSSRRHSVKRLRPNCTWTFPTQRSGVCPRLHGNATRVKRVSGSYLT